jgi:ankyrin repeat protein
MGGCGNKYFGMSVGHKRGRSPDTVGDYGKATEELERYMLNTPAEEFSAQRLIDLIGRGGADPNHRCGVDGKTPLMCLADMGIARINGRVHDEIMRGFRFLLQRHNIDVNLRERNGNVLIHKVVRMADPAFLTILFENKASREHVNSVGGIGFSPLHIACSFSTVSIQNIQTLLENGADPYLPSHAILGYAPLLLAVRECGKSSDLGRLKHILGIFLDYGVDIGEFRGARGETIMHVVAVYVNDAGFCTNVLNHGGYRVLNVRNNAGRTPLEEAEILHRVNVIEAIKRYMSRVTRAG